MEQRPRFWIPIVHDLGDKLEQIVNQLAMPAIELLASFGIDCEVIYHAPYDDENDNDLDASINPHQCSCFIVCSDSCSLAGWFAEGQGQPIVAVPIGENGKQGQAALLDMAKYNRSGYPYAMMGINAVFNAALYCLQILAATDSEVARQWEEYSARAQQDAERAMSGYTFPI